MHVPRSYHLLIVGPWSLTNSPGMSTNVEITVDLLSPVNGVRFPRHRTAWLGVSGLQPWTPPLHGSPHLTQPSWSVAVRPCQLAVTPILSVDDSHLLSLPAGSH